MSPKRFSAVAVVLFWSAAAFAEIGALSLVPSDAVSVGVVHLKELRTSPLSSTLFEHADKVGCNGEADRFLTDAGLDPGKDIDLLVVAASPRTRLGSEGEVLVAAEGRFNADRLTKALLARGATRKTTEHGVYYILPDSEEPKGAAAFPTSSLALVGSESAVIEALATRAAGGGTFTAASLLGRDAAARIDRDASAWAIVDITRASRLGVGPRLPRGRDQSGDALTAAIRSVSTVAVWATDTGDALKLGAFGLANDEETLALLEDTIRGAFAAMRLAVKDKSPDMVSVLRRFDVDRTSDSVRVSGTIPAESLRKLMAHKRAQK